MLNGWTANYVIALNRTFITNTTEKIMTTKTVKKKAPRKKSSAAKTDDLSPKIILTSKCQTLTKKSTLTYHVGSDDEENIFIRVFSNSGGGYFSNEWISLDKIMSILQNATDDGPITSINLIPLFKGQSSNTPGFMLAALLNEGVLAPLEDKKRSYVFSGVDKFLAKIAKKTK